MDLQKMLMISESRWLYLYPLQAGRYDTFLVAISFYRDLKG
jgi:hypothetical protein